MSENLGNSIESGLTTIAGERAYNLVTRDSIRSHEEQDALFREIMQLEYLSDPSERPVFVTNGEYLRANGVLSDREIKVGLEIGHLICDPYPTGRINGSSVDVTLGRYFYAAGEPHTSDTIFNPYSYEDTLRYFGIKDPHTDFLEARPWGEVLEKVKKQMGQHALSKYEDMPHLERIPEDHPMILLRPGERILAHTNEFIGILPPGTTSMQARSTMGRIGLSACYCAGWGDPGYFDRWTMEIHNLNENEYLPLPVGFRPAQIVFNATGSVAKEYTLASGNYQESAIKNPAELRRQSRANRLAEIKANWRPYSMIPRAYKNEILPPTPVDGLQEGVK